ncbi:MAG TPA: PIN domain-containing protein [Chitinophagales bacterium]|nr:PIN domain-containing protein [Chitinophagales bacterium]
MKQYLIDTGICVHYLKGKHELNKKFDAVDPDHLFISEITLAELKCAVELSDATEKNYRALDLFLSGVKVLPVFHALDLYAKEKARLLRAGTAVDDYDLLIGATAVTHNLTLITDSKQNMQPIKSLKLEDWTQ